MGSGLKFHPVTHVIFDLDGLILDSESIYPVAINNLCKKYNSEYTAEARKLAMGTVARDSAAIITKHCNLPIDVDTFMKEIDEEYDIAFKNGVDFMPGAKRLIHHLAEHNIPIAIATSGRLKYYKLKTAGHDATFRLFRHIVFGSEDEEVKCGKPAPDIFRVAASRFEIPAESHQHVLVFEDAKTGVIGGLAAGMQVVWVPTSCFDTAGQSTTLLLKSLEDFQPEVFGLPKFPTA